MEITSTGKEKDAVKVSVKGRMDAVTAPDFEKQLGEWMEGGESVFIVDLSELDYISSAGLRSVLAVAKKLKAGGGKIILASLQEAVKEVFEISGFSSIIPIFDSIEAALEQV
jgi:anti-anti-sigma factor